MLDSNCTSLLSNYLSSLRAEPQFIQKSMYGVITRIATDGCPQGGLVEVNVNCHELTANFGELIFFNLRIIYGDSRSYKNYCCPQADCVLVSNWHE